MDNSDNDQNFDEDEMAPGEIEVPDDDTVDDFVDSEDVAGEVEVIEGEVEVIEGNDDSDEEEPDLSILTFRTHTKSVFKSSLSKDGRFAVTGGEDDMAYVWSTQNGDVILECTGHKDSVTEVGFNHDDSLVATGDMAGRIQVWSLKEKKLIWCNDLEDDMEWLFWHPSSNYLFSGSKGGEIYVWDVMKGNMKILPSHGAVCKCAKLLPNGYCLIAAYSDGSVKLWDMKTSGGRGSNHRVVWQYSDPTNTDLTGLDINFDGSLLALAPTSTIIKISDGRAITSLLLPNEVEVESIIFCSEMNMLLTGSNSGQLCTWDLSRRAVRHQAKINGGVTVSTLGTGGKVYVGDNSGHIYVYDVSSGSLVKTLSGHGDSILSLTLSYDNTMLLSTSDDFTAKIFDVRS